MSAYGLFASAGFVTGIVAIWLQHWRILRQQRRWEAMTSTPDWLTRSGLGTRTAQGLRIRFQASPLPGTWCLVCGIGSVLATGGSWILVAVGTVFSLGGIILLSGVNAIIDLQLVRSDVVVNQKVCWRGIVVRTRLARIGRLKCIRLVEFKPDEGPLMRFISLEGEKQTVTCDLLGGYFIRWMPYLSESLGVALSEAAYESLQGGVGRN